MYIENHLTGDDMQRMHDQCPKPAATLLAGSYVSLLEAIDIFTEKKSLLRDQLGHRMGDAWALIAKAYDMVGHEDSARQAYRNATLLTPVAEISRKYAEVASLTGKYTAAIAPNE